MIGAGSSLATFLFFCFLSLGNSREAYSVIFCNIQKCINVLESYHFLLMNDVCVYGCFPINTTYEY